MIGHHPYTSSLTGLKNGVQRRSLQRAYRPYWGLTKRVRRRDAPGTLAGEARLKSQNHDRQNPTDGKCTPPRDATQAQGTSERGRVAGRLHARVGRLPH